MKARIESLQQCRHRLASVIPAFMLYLQFMSQSQCCLCHPPSAALKASSNTRYFGSTSTAAFVTPHATNLGRIRLTSLSSATVRPASEAQPSTSQSKYEVVAHSPVLGGDIIRIRTGPDEDYPVVTVLPQPDEGDAAQEPYTGQMVFRHDHPVCARQCPVHGTYAQPVEDLDEHDPRRQHLPQSTTLVDIMEGQDARTGTEV